MESNLNTFVNRVPAGLRAIVAKLKSGPYLPPEPFSWVKIRNRSYSQWVGREELFERERGGDPDFRG
jgi:hypothetical protein